MIELDVLGAALWPPTPPSAAVSGDLTQPIIRPETELLSVRTRGRASLLTLMFANVIERACAAAAIDRRSVPSIFGSAYGEMNTTMALLEMLYAAEGRLSPAKFQASVHNTAAGQISIAQGNRSFSSSIAAGYDTLAMSLLEAAAWLESRPGAILVACADEAAPAVLLPEHSYAPLAVALVLSNVPNSSPPLARLRRLVQTTSPYEATAERANPCAAGLPLIQAICDPAARSTATVVLNRAARQTWQIDVLPNFPGP